jgi:hypothetical protein
MAPHPDGDLAAEFASVFEIAENPSARRKECSVSEVSVSAGDPGRIKTPEERKALLDSALHLWGARGFRIENRSDFQATVSKGKEIRHVLHIVLSFLTGGMWLFVYIPLWLLTGIRRRMVSIDEYGNTIEHKLTTL